MPNRTGSVVRNRSIISEGQFSDALVAGLARVAAKIGRGNLADKAGRTPRALSNVFSGSIPEGIGLLEFLHADPTALDEVLALYGFGIHKLPSTDPQPGDDIEDIAALNDLTGAKIQALGDGKRDHRNVINIGEKARPVAMACHRMMAAAHNAKQGRVA